MDRRKYRQKKPKRHHTTNQWLGLSAIASLIAMLMLPVASAPVGAITLYPCVSLTPSSQVALVGNNAQLTATVTGNSLPDCSGNSIPLQVPVQFSVTGTNTITSGLNTNQNGLATFTYSSDTVGFDQVTATAGQTTSAAATVDWITTSATNLSLTPATVNASRGTSQTWTVTVTDTDGNPIAGVPISYMVSGANTIAATTDGTTNASGQVTFSYTGANSGDDTVTAWADFNGNNQQDSGELSGTSQAHWSTSASVAISPTTLTKVTGSALTLTATVTGDNSNPLQGVTVNYSISGANPKSGSASTDANGQVTFTDSGTNAGTDTVHASVSGVSTPATATIQWIAGPATITMSASDTTPAAHSQVTVMATLHDTNGVGIANVPVIFNVTGVNTASGTATTNSSGQATFQYTDTSDGADTVTAYADFNRNSTDDAGEPSNSIVINWGNVAGLTLAPSTQSVQVGNAATLNVTLTNPGGSVGSIPVKVQITGANAQDTTVTTDSGGKATITYSGTVTGTDTISAWADLNSNGSQDTGEPSATSSVTWTAPALFQPAQPASPKSGCTYFAATQHNLCAGFQAYWNTFGGLGPFGMPLTEEFVENGMTVQYFERAVFEWHPGAWPSHFDVELRLLGDEITAGRGNEAPFQPAQPSSDSGCMYFAATGHNVCGAFLQFWNAYGDLNTNGYPISESFQEKNPDTGEVYTVQYFERVRMELHPGGWPSHYNIFLGRLGAQSLQVRYGVMYY